MTHQSVNSSFIKSVGHDKETKIMEVKMTSGQTYTHEDVSEEEFQELLDAPSVGTHYNLVFKK